MNLFKDPYERKARVYPALLVMLPILVPIVGTYGAENTVLTGIAGLVLGCGAIYAVANVARGRGKVLEEKLIGKWGGMPTTIALRHRDDFLDSVSKRRYHEAIRERLGIAIPTAVEESEDTTRADDIYVGATRRLRELTRDNKELLLEENISYGFHRNMVAMKPVGIIICLIGIAYGMVLTPVIQVSSPYFYLEYINTPGLAAGLTLAISVALLLLWILHFNKTAVKRAGFAYAERLFECLESL